jgi:hypothetical protein
LRDLHLQPLYPPRKVVVYQPAKNRDDGGYHGSQDASYEPYPIPMIHSFPPYMPLCHRL